MNETLRKIISGYLDTPPVTTEEMTAANKFAQIAQEQVFEKLGTGERTQELGDDCALIRRFNRMFLVQVESRIISLQLQGIHPALVAAPQ